MSQTDFEAAAPILEFLAEIREKYAPAPQGDYPTKSENQMLAYLIWEKQGWPEGVADANWFEAKKILEDLFPPSPTTT